MSTIPFETAPRIYPISYRKTIPAQPLRVSHPDVQNQSPNSGFAHRGCNSLKNIQAPNLSVGQNLHRQKKQHAQIKLGDMPSLNSCVRLTHGHHNLLIIMPEVIASPRQTRTASGLPEHNHYCGSGDGADLRHEKGSTANAALWYRSPDDILSIHYKIVVVQKKTYENFVVQSLGSSFAFLRWRRLISPLAAVTKKPAVLSPSSLSNSISSITSWGILTVVICDLAFFAPVTITDTPCIWCMSVYVKKATKKELRCISPCCSLCGAGEIHQRKCKARQCANTNRASNHNVTRTYTMAYSHSTQTRPEKHLWRFLALDRADMDAIPRRVSIEAPTEHDARKVLAPYFILSLAARLPAQGVCNV